MVWVLAVAVVGWSCLGPRDREEALPRVMAALLLMTLTCAAYSPIWGAGYVYEDAHWLPGAVWALAMDVPMTVAVYGPWHVATVVSGGHPYGVHALVLVTHLLNGWLLFRLIRRIWGESAAWLGAGLFLLHPINSEAVAYASGGREVLAACWLLLALTVGLADRGWTWLRGIGAALLAMVAIAAKPDAVMVLVLVPGALWLLTERRVAQWATAALGIVAALRVVPEARAILSLQQSEHVLYVGWQGLTTFAGVTSAAITYRLLQIPLPMGFSVDADWRGWVLQFPHGPIVLLTLCAGLTACALGGCRRWPRLAGAWLWLVVALLPRFVIQQEEVLNEHQLYLALLPLWGAIGAGLVSVWHWFARDRDLGSVPPSPEWLGMGDPW